MGAGIAAGTAFCHNDGLILRVWMSPGTRSSIRCQGLCWLQILLTPLCIGLAVMSGWENTLKA